MADHQVADFAASNPVAVGVGVGVGSEAVTFAADATALEAILDRSEGVPHAVKETGENTLLAQAPRVLITESLRNAFLMQALVAPKANRATPNNLSG
jgi:hypothetical protein